MQLGQINRADDKPPYRQIASMLRSAISSNQLAAGARLPSEAALIDHFGVARMTVRQAVRELRSEGLVIAEQGRGTFVRPTSPPQRLTSDRYTHAHSAEQGDTPGLHIDSGAVTRRKPNPIVAERLRLNPDDDVIVGSLRYLGNGVPLQTATVYVPAAIADGTSIEQAHADPGSVHAFLAEAGYPIARFTEEVRARMATPDERRDLHLSAGTPVLTVIRTAYDSRGVAVEVCDMVKVASAYLLEYDISVRNSDRPEVGEC